MWYADAGHNRFPERPLPRKTLLVAIGVDCDPDRDVYPRQLAWRGVEALPRILTFPDVKWTLNVRADTQIQAHCGSASYCWDRYRPIWQDAREQGSEIAWHLHYFGDDGQQDISQTNICENIRVGAEALGPPPVVHMGWTFQNDFSVQQLANSGVQIDYSPVPRLAFQGRGGTDAYDWTHFAYRPQLWHGIRMIPAYSYADRILARRFGTERVMLTITTAPMLYRRLLRSFFQSGSDFFVSYFHADEIAAAVGGWRNRLYSLENLKTNLTTLRRMAADHNFSIEFLTVSDLADALFDEHRSRYT